MPFAGAWCKVWIYFGFVFAWTKGARPRFDTSTDMGLVLVPADAEVDSVIFRLRATDQDADFPLVFEITATITPVVKIDNLPCTLYNKVCQANVILTKRLVPGRLHDFAVRVRDTKGDSNSMQATISVTNATTPRDKIFPHIPSLIMVPEDTKPGKELNYLLVRANQWSGKPVYIELWQPKELFTIRQRQTPTQTRGTITLIGELDFETQSMYTLTMYATDPYTEPGKDTRNIAGLNVVVVVQDVQDVPPIFTLAPPLTRINNSVQPGDIVLRVHAEDGDKGVPREIVYGLVSEGNPFTPFFNISETSGEITLARPLEELTQITHVGAPVVLTVVAEELRRSREEPPAQATVVDVGFLLGEPGNSPPYFESDNYIATIDENPEPGTVINFGEQYSTRVKDEDIGKAGVFALKLENNNGTFEVNPTVAERTADFVITVRDNTLIDYELYKSLTFKIIAQEVGPATNLSASTPVTIFLRDINDNPPVFEEESYEVTLSENVTAGSRVVQVHATDKDTGVYGSVRYTNITGEGSEAFVMDPDTGLITVAMGSSLDREVSERLILSIEAQDENGNGNRGVVPLIVNLLDVNDNAPIFEKEVYEFMLNTDLTNFTSPAFIKAVDADAEPPNNIVRYEIVQGNYENKFYLNETSGELILRSPITKIRRKKQSAYGKVGKKVGKEFVKNQGKVQDQLPTYNRNMTDETELLHVTEEVMKEIIKKRRKRANDDALYTLTTRAYDLGVPHLSSVTQIQIISGIAMEARIMMFVVPGEKPDSVKTAETLATITGGRVTVLETRPYVPQNHTGNSSLPAGGKKSIIVARVEQTEPGTPLVDVEKIRETLAANGVGIIAGTDTVPNTTMNLNDTKAPVSGMPRANGGQITNINNTITNVQSEEVTVYKAENKLLFWLLIILGLLMLLAIAALIICCICPGCPFYMAPNKRRVHSSETLLMRADGRPKRHLHRLPAAIAQVTWNGRKQAWSADPTRRNWQFNKRNIKNCSLPGDVAYISGQQNDVQMNVDVPRFRDEPRYNHSRRSRMVEQERMYIEDVKGLKIRGYDAAEMDSLQRHEVERGSDVQRQNYRQRYMDPDVAEDTTVREQHFYREGNAEVLRLVTRGQIEDTAMSHHQHHHRPTTLIVDGKDIILQRFIEDQKSRHDLSVQDIEVARSIESHQRSKDMRQQQPPELIVIPDRLELGHRQHVEEIGPTVQRLVIDHGDYGSQKMERESQIRETVKQEREENVPAGAPMSERPPGVSKQNVPPSNAEYSFHDLELARQNALLTRLLLERDNRHPGGGIVDSTSYLETQSLPGQVAIATQTDRTTATQTERRVRSRSDNDDSEEDSRQRKKLKSRKKYSEGDWKRPRTLWMKSPIEEEGSPCFDKRLSILRRKVREVKEGRKVSLEPDVLKEISDSLDGNGSSYKGEEDETVQTYHKSKQQTSIRYKVLKEQEDKSQSSEEVCRDKREKAFGEKSKENTTDDHRTNPTESTSSPEIKVQREKHGRERSEQRSPRKEAKSKASKKSEGIIKPSFRILEKEFTLLTKKLSKLGDKKFQESTGSDSTSQEKPGSLPKDPRKDLDQKSSKTHEASSSRGQKQAPDNPPSTSKTDKKGVQKKETAISKTRQKLKYQLSQVMSTGSSEYDDASDKPKKRSSGIRQESLKQKQPMGSQGHAKLKRQMQTDRREFKKPATEFRDGELERRKDGLSKEALKTESKTERTGKTMARAPKLAAISRKDHVSEEFSTSTNSDRAERRRDTSSFPESVKKSSTESSGKDSNGVHRRDRQSIEKVIGRFSDDFVEIPEMDTPAASDLKKQHGAEHIKKKETINDKESNAISKVKPTKKETRDTQISVEKSGKKKEQTAPEKTIERSASLRDVAQQLITSCVVPGSTQITHEKLSEISSEEDRKFVKKISSTKPEHKEEKNKSEHLIHDENTIKPSENEGAKADKEKDVIISEVGKEKKHDMEVKHEQESKELDTDLHKYLNQSVTTLSKDHDEKDMSLQKSKKENGEMAQTFPKQKDMALEELKKAVELEMAQTSLEQTKMSLEELKEEVDPETAHTSPEQKKMAVEELKNVVELEMAQTSLEQRNMPVELKKKSDDEIAQTFPEQKNMAVEELKKVVEHEVAQMSSEHENMSGEELKKKTDDEMAQTSPKQKDIAPEESKKETDHEIAQMSSEEKDVALKKVKKETDHEMAQMSSEETDMALKEIQKGTDPEMAQMSSEEKDMALKELKKEVDHEMARTSSEEKYMELEKLKKEIDQEMAQMSSEENDVAAKELKKEVDHEMAQTSSEEKDMAPKELKKEVYHEIAQTSSEEKDMAPKELKKEVDHEMAQTSSEEKDMAPKEVKKEVDHEMAQTSSEQEKAKTLAHDTDINKKIRTQIEDNENVERRKEIEVKIEQFVEVLPNNNVEQETKESVGTHSESKSRSVEEDNAKPTTSDETKKDELLESNKQLEKYKEHSEFMHEGHVTQNAKEDATETVPTSHEKGDIHLDSVDDTDKEKKADTKGATDDSELKETVFLDKENTSDGVKETVPKLSIDDQNHRSEITENTFLDQEKKGKKEEKKAVDENSKGTITETIIEGHSTNGKETIFLGQKTIFDQENETTKMKIDDSQINKEINVSSDKERTPDEVNADNKLEISEIKENENFCLDNGKPVTSVTADEPETSKEENSFPDEEKSVTRVTADEHETSRKENSFSDKEKPVTSVTADEPETSKNENSFSDEENPVTSVKADEAETSKKDNASPDKEEVTVVDTTTDDRLTVERDVSPEKEQNKNKDGQSVEEKVPSDSETSEQNTFPVKEEEERSKEEVGTTQDNVSLDTGKEKENKKEQNFTDIQITHGQPLSGTEKVTLEIFTVALQPILEMKDCDNRQKDVGNDNVKDKKHEFSEIPVSPQQHSLEDDISTKDSTTIDHTMTNVTPSEESVSDDQTSNQKGIFSKMFTAVHSLVDKLTTGTESVDSVSAEPKIIEPSTHSNDKVIKEKESSSPVDDKSKDQIEPSTASESSDLKVDNQGVSSAKEETITMEPEKEVEEAKLGAPTDDKMIVSPKGMTKKDEKIDTVAEAKAKEPEESEIIDKLSEDETATLITKDPSEKKELDERSDDKLVTTMEVTSDVKETTEERDTLGDNAEASSEKAVEESRELPDNKTMDGELVQTRERKDESQGPSTEVSSCFQGIELPETSKQSRDDAEAKEKFALDSIISETPTDSMEVSAPEKESKSESEQTELREAEQFVEKQTSATEGDRIRPSLDEQSRKEQNVPAISRAKLSKQDATEGKMDQSLTSGENVATKEEEESKPGDEEYADVSLPLFTSIIDTVDDSNDSDSSSDISRKTTLTTRPYQTPRHRSQQSLDTEDAQATESSEMENIDNDEGSLTIELMEDETTEPSGDDKMLEEIEHANEEQSPTEELIETVTEIEPREKEEVSASALVPFIQGKVIAGTEEDKQLISKSSSGPEEPPTSTKHPKNTKLESKPKNLPKSESSSGSKRRIAESIKTVERKVKEIGKKRLPWGKKKKTSSEESSEERATHSQDPPNHTRYRLRKQTEDQTKQKDGRPKESKKSEEGRRRKPSMSKLKSEKKSSSGSEKLTPPKTGEIDTSKAQPKYMAWYKKNREEMEKKRAEAKTTDDEDQLPRWLRRSMRYQKADKDAKRKSDQNTADTPRTKRKVKPLVNVESEQLKAIVRQGRKLRKAEGGRNEDPPVQIFAPVPPASAPDTKHHLVQHSEYKYEKIPAPFYLHPPPAPHPSPQLSPERFDVQPTMERGHADDDFDPGIAVSLQGGNRLRHQQLLEKKSVFDIAYSEAAPSQLRSDSTTPPS